MAPLRVPPPESGYKWRPGSGSATRRVRPRCIAVVLETTLTGSVYAPRKYGPHVPWRGGDRSGHRGLREPLHPAPARRT